MTTERSRLNREHNRFLGHAIMARTQMLAMQKAPTVSLEAKSLAAQIEGLTYRLSEALKTREEI